ncbi:MAG: hypothetical protein KUG78_03400 [Kangiellaceae bacterium]|nr:hypothetical protein [Kangiellaceae bacterium]
MSKLSIGLVSSPSEESDQLSKLLKELGVDIKVSIAPDQIKQGHIEGAELNVWLLNINDDDWHDNIDQLLDESDASIYFNEPGNLSKHSHPSYWCKNLVSRLYELTGLDNDSAAGETELKTDNATASERISTAPPLSAETDTEDSLTSALDELESSSVGLPSDITAELVSELESISPQLEKSIEDSEAVDSTIRKTEIEAHTLAVHSSTEPEPEPEPEPEVLVENKLESGALAFEQAPVDFENEIIQDATASETVDELELQAPKLEQLEPVSAPQMEMLDEEIDMETSNSDEKITLELETADISEEILSMADEDESVPTLTQPAELVESEVTNKSEQISIEDIDFSNSVNPVLESMRDGDLNQNQSTFDTDLIDESIELESNAEDSISFDVELDDIEDIEQVNISELPSNESELSLLDLEEPSLLDSEVPVPVLSEPDLMVSELVEPDLIELDLSEEDSAELDFSELELLGTDLPEAEQSYATDIELMSELPDETVSENTLELESEIPAQPSSSLELSDDDYSVEEQPLESSTSESTAEYDLSGLSLESMEEEEEEITGRAVFIEEEPVEEPKKTDPEGELELPSDGGLSLESIGETTQPITGKAQFVIDDEPLEEELMILAEQNESKSKQSDENETNEIKLDEAESVEHSLVDENHFSDNEELDVVAPAELNGLENVELETTESLAQELDVAEFEAAELISTEKGFSGAELQALEIEQTNNLSNEDSFDKLSREPNQPIVLENESEEFEIPMLDDAATGLDFDEPIEKKTQQQPLSHCWVIGASLGGPAAVKRFLQSLPQDINASFVITQHIDENFLPVLADILTSSSPFEVKVANGCNPMSAGKIYLAPLKGKLIFLQDGSMLVDHSQKWSEPYSPCIDDVIDSLSAVYKERSGAIIFSGMGQDGLRGATKMKVLGGTVWAQSVETCANGSMPEAVIEADIASVIASPEELAKQLAELVID